MVSLQEVMPGLEKINFKSKYLPASSLTDESVVLLLSDAFSLQTSRLCNQPS